MKSYFQQILFAMVLFVPMQLLAFDWDCCWNSWAPKDASLEVRAAYFRPTSKKVRDIYSDGWATYEARGSVDFCNNLQVWLGLDWSHKEGRSLGLRDKTKLHLIPVTLGVKYVFDIAPCTQFYVGGGACYSFLKIHDHSPYVHQHISKRTWGGIAEAGATYYFGCNFFADIFVDYIYQKFNFSNSGSGYSSYVERHDVDLSGFKVGGGLGVTF